VPLIVACGLFMENLDSTVLGTALPAMAKSLDVNPLWLNLAITAYLFSLAIFIPVSGWVADKFGARDVFRAAIAVFVTGSVLCGLSSSIVALVCARVLQGIGGAMMVPVGRLVVLRLVPHADLVRAMTYLTVPAMIGPVIGPPLGGLITTYSSWRLIFWINVPIGILGIYLVSRFVPDAREHDVLPIDIRGFLLSGIGLIGLVVGFESLGRGLFPTGVVAASLIVGLAGIALYMRHARHVSNPILDLALLGLPTFRAAIAGGSLFRIGIGALPFLLPLLLQVGFGLNPLQSGLLTFASAAGALMMKLAANPLLARFGFKRVLIGTTLIGAASIAMCATFTPSTSEIVILLVLLAGGFFRSLQFTSVNVIAYAEVEPRQLSHATSFASTAQQLSISMGVAVAALILHLTAAAKATGDLAAGDFIPAFLVVAAVSASAALVYASLPADAGAALARPPSDRYRVEVRSCATPSRQT
jgi:EmrB/QacA subfamily drug resistance transporter